VKLITHLLLLVLRSRLRGAIPPPLQYVFVAWYLVKHRDNFAVPSVIRQLWSFGSGYKKWNSHIT
jgi:hypothetical protein